MRRDTHRHGPPPPAPGRYTVVFADGGHRTLDVVAAGRGFKGGPLVVCFLCGPDNTSDYRPFAHIDGTGAAKLWKRFRGDSALAQALRVLMADPDSAASAYAIESKRCSRCRRPLTRPDSIQRGLGERCAQVTGLLETEGSSRPPRLATSLEHARTARPRRGHPPNVE